MFANQESDLKNRCFSQRKEFIFVICDKGPWKLNNEEETRNYFESICGDTESTQEITDVITSKVIWKTDYSKRESEILSRLALRMILIPQGLRYHF